VLSLVSTAEETSALLQKTMRNIGRTLLQPMSAEKRMNSYNKKINE
jgi:hypothetical protein